MLALPRHRKNGYIEKDVLVPAVAAGLVCAGMDTGVLRKIFGVFLLLVGLWQLCNARKE